MEEGRWLLLADIYIQVGINMRRNEEKWGEMGRNGRINGEK